MMKGSLRVSYLKLNVCQNTSSQMHRGHMKL